MLQLLMTLFNINRAKFEVDELSLETFHGTTREIATIILNEGFKIIPKEVTNDLGNGIYTFGLTIMVAGIQKKMQKGTLSSINEGK